MTRTDCDECVTRATAFLNRAVPAQRRVKDQETIDRAITGCANWSHRYHLLRGRVEVCDGSSTTERGAMALKAFCDICGNETDEPWTLNKPMMEKTDAFAKLLGAFAAPMVNDKLGYESVLLCSRDCLNAWIALPSRFSSDRGVSGG